MAQWLSFNYYVFFDYDGPNPIHPQNSLKTVTLLTEKAHKRISINVLQSLPGTYPAFQLLMENPKQKCYNTL